MAKPKAKPKAKKPVKKKDVFTQAGELLKEIEKLKKKGIL